MQKRWVMASDSIAESNSRIREVLLNNRGIKEQKDFFSPPEPTDLINRLPVYFPDLDLKQLAKAIGRIRKAISSGEKITVWGDYDVDGVCATAVLWQTLHGLGADVLPYIPDRFKEGYGLNSAAIERLARDGRSLIITVDSGITAREESEAAKKAGVDLIITDHHLLPKILPKAFAIVHTTELCGTGVAWLLASKLSPKPYSLDPSLDLVAIATVADLQPLLGANRSLVRTGFEVLNKLERPGLAALAEIAGLKPGTLGSYAAGWVFGPRINAVGRLKHGIEALRLLCTTDPARASRLAQVLNRVNAERQELTVHTFDHAKELVDGKLASPAGRDELIVVYHDRWHEGIIGLVAGRIAEEYGRPAIVIAQGKEFSKGSARSVNGINMVEVLRSQESLLKDVGGHEAAAGFTIKSANLEKFVKSVRRESRPLLANLDPRPLLKIDLPLPIDRINLKLLEELEEFSPYGVGNPEPVFVDWGVRVLGKKRVGRTRQHLKLVLLGGLEAIWFGVKGDEPSFDQPVSLSYTPQIELWQGREKVVLRVQDLKSAGGRRP